MLHVAVTGRTASMDPNGQNFPKRNRWAKQYQSSFIPSPGFVMVGADLSQAELRIAAWMANETTMIDIYRRGGDIHIATAAATIGMTEEQLASYKNDERIVLEHPEEANRFEGIGQWLRNLSGDARRTATFKDFVKLLRFRAKAITPCKF